MVVSLVQTKEKLRFIKRGGSMKGKRKIGSVAAIGGLSAAIVLLTLPAATADELADLRAKQQLLQSNQELLQKRIDQLSQAPPPGAPRPYVPGFGPETRPLNAPVTTGSFPRSFLIPGTDTSLRIGGLAATDVLWYLKGASMTTQLNGQGGINNATFFDGQGGTGNLGSIPLNNSINHSRSSAFDISARSSRILFDARTPTAWGEVKAYFEMDFSQNTNAVQNNYLGVASGFIPRLRKFYGTWGGFLAGQETGILHDPDADAEFVDQGGAATAAGRAREPQVKYTYQGPYGMVFTAGFENPVPRLNGPFGQVDIDTTQIANVAACSASGNTAANLPATTACLGSQATFSPLKPSYPEAIATARINNPWGHIQIGGVVRADQLDDGQYFDHTFVGYGGTLSGDVHPFSGTPGPLGKDDLGFGICGGIEMGGQCANGVGVVTNFGANINVPGFGFVNPLTSAQWNTANSTTRRAYDAAVRSQSPGTAGAWLWYQHWWTIELRSTIEAAGIYNSLNTNLLPQGTTNNKFLALSHLNLFWSPVAFVDWGLEYAYGHRVTVANFKGDASTLEGRMVVRF
jgi:hypothetical protein